LLINELLHITHETYFLSAVWKILVPIFAMIEIGYRERERERYLKTFIILEIFADNFLCFNQKPLKLTCKVVIESYGNNS
jgi:hypothetical protein